MPSRPSVRSPLLSANDIVEREVLQETVLCRGRVRPASPEGAVHRGAGLEPEVEPDRLTLLRKDILEVVDVPVQGGQNGLYTGSWRVQYDLRVSTKVLT